MGILSVCLHNTCLSKPSTGRRLHGARPTQVIALQLATVQLYARHVYSLTKQPRHAAIQASPCNDRTWMSTETVRRNVPIEP